MPHMSANQTSAVVSPIKIEQWFVTSRDPKAPYIPPTTKGQIAGHVIGFLGEDVNEKVFRIVNLDRIVDAKGRFFSTKSGAVFQLGKPSPDYLNFLKKNCPEYDSNNPIRMIRG